MQGLSLEVRYKMLQEAQKIVLARLKHPGSRILILTTCDLGVYRSLLFDFHNGRSGRCDPGMRHLARKAGVALGTVPSAIRRLCAAGFMSIQRRFTQALGRWIRMPHQYDIAEIQGPVQSLDITPKKKEKVRGIEEQLRLLSLPPKEFQDYLNLMKATP